MPNAVRHPSSAIPDPRQRELVLSYPVSKVMCSDLIPLFREWLRDRAACRYVACANPHSLVVAGSDEDFATALREADLLVPDGVGVVLAARIRGGGIRERVTGMDVFRSACDALAETKGRVYFLGSTDCTLSRLIDTFEREYPGVHVAGYESPPFTPLDEVASRGIVERINDARPDLLCVGMTAPKQEKWLRSNRERLRVPVALAIGAVFDFYAGNKKRSGPLFQRLGLEWLPRLIREPRRLWRRTLVSAPVFLWRVLRDRHPREVR